MLRLAWDTLIAAHVNQGITQISPRQPTALIANQEGGKTAQAVQLALLACLDDIHRKSPVLSVMNAMRDILVGQKLERVNPVLKALIPQKLLQSVNLAVQAPFRAEAQAQHAPAVV